MDTQQIIGLVFAGLLISSNYINSENISKIWTKIKDKYFKEGVDIPFKTKDKDQNKFSIVDAVSKFQELKGCLEEGGKSSAVEALDKVFPLINE